MVHQIKYYYSSFGNNNIIYGQCTSNTNSSDLYKSSGNLSKENSLSKQNKKRYKLKNTKDTSKNSSFIMLWSSEDNDNGTQDSLIGSLDRM